MTVYVVLSEGAHGAEIEKIFTTRTKAEVYQTELKKQYPYYSFYIEEHWAV